MMIPATAFGAAPPKLTRILSSVIPATVTAPVKKEARVWFHYNGRRHEDGRRRHHHCDLRRSHDDLAVTCVHETGTSQQHRQQRDARPDFDSAQQTTWLVGGLFLKYDLARMDRQLHKVCGPTGSAVLVCRRDKIAERQPRFVFQFNFHKS